MVSAPTNGVSRAVSRIASRNVRQGLQSTLRTPRSGGVDSQVDGWTGNRTTKRAPRPSSGGSSATVPWWVSAPRARSRARGRTSRSGRRRRGRSARRPCRAARRDARARRPRPRARRWPLGARRSPRPPCRGRCGAARSPSGSAPAGAARRARRDDLAPGGAEIEISWSPATGSSSAAASVTTLGEVDRLVGGSRPASARASSSRSATRRRIRREERSAEAAASRCSPSSSSSSSSRLASTEVSGVRSSCEASATNSRWRASVASVSARASSSACEHRLQRPRQLGDLVLGLRAAGSARRDRACARSRARSSVSSAIGSIARRAVARPASSASAAPPSTPRPRNSFTRLAVACDVARAAARTGRTTEPCQLGDARRARDSTRQPWISQRRRQRRAEVRARSARPRSAVVRR